MNLIGTRIIIDYIAKFPGARIPLFVFLKEFSSRPDLKSNGNPIIGDVSFNIDGLDCIVGCQSNYHLNIFNILKVNTMQELLADNNKFLIKDTEIDDQVALTKAISISIATPTPPSLENGKFQNSGEPNSLLLNELDNHEFNHTHIHSDVEYNQYMDRVKVIFDTEPGMAEFKELEAIIPLVIHYEESKLNSDLKIYEHFKFKMDLFSYTPTNFREIVAEDDLAQFLKGKHELEYYVLTQLFSFLAIDHSIYSQSNKNLY